MDHGGGPGPHVGIGQGSEAQNIRTNPVVNSTMGQIESGQIFSKYFVCWRGFFHNLSGFQSSQFVLREINPSGSMEEEECR